MIWFSRRGFYIFFKTRRFRNICKAGDVKEVFRTLDDLYDDEDYDLVIQFIDYEIRAIDLKKDYRRKKEKLRSDAVEMLQKRKYMELEKIISELIGKGQFAEAKDKLDEHKEELDNDGYKSLMEMVESKEIEQANAKVRQLLEDGMVKEAYNAFGELRKTFKIHELDQADELLTQYAQSELPVLFEAGEYDKLNDILNAAVSVPGFGRKPAVSELKAKLEKMVFDEVHALIMAALDSFDKDLAEAELEKSKQKLSFQQITDLKGIIDSVCNSKESFIHALKLKITPMLEKGEYESVMTMIENAENSYDEKLLELRDEVRKHKEAMELAKKEEQIKDLVSKVNSKLDAYELNEIDAELESLKTQIAENEKFQETYSQSLSDLQEKYGKAKEAVLNENKYRGEFKINPIGTFNVEKKQDAGEDADPTLYADNTRSWGVVAVYDGMGGAGARKYVHKDTQEEHSSAYWASRYVKSAVEEYIKARPLGADPVEYFESAIHSVIKQRLDSELENFPAAKSSTISRMIAKLPTTMALCLYQIADEQVQLNFYWAGDSRVYMFDGEKFYFCTVDDANAPDGDPFSPANSDLAMNNRICQDQPYRINKSETTLKYDPARPIVLFAATDGCFGYYKNPIEFERMVLTAVAGQDKEQWLPVIRQAIIDNIQQDDFSISLVVIGDDSHETLSEAVNQRLSDPVFSEYIQWKDSERQAQSELSEKVAELGSQIEGLLNGINDAKEKAATIEECKTECRAYLEKWMHVISTPDTNVEEHQFYLEVCERLDSMQFDEETAKNEIQKIREKRNTLKAELEDRQLKSQDLNNDWYAKYRMLIEVVQPSKTI